MRLYNSLTRNKDPFTARDNRVGVYVCGITPYDATHLGHAFTYVHFDILVRYLRHLGYRVTYVQNLTDIDDDILRKSKELGRNWRALGEEVADRFLEDMSWLGNFPPEVYPRATDLISEIIVLSETLLRKGWAYESGGSVYFKVRSFKRFGLLSRLPEDRWLPTANERGNFPDDSKKQDPLDFVLWQAMKPGEPAWPSPWGKGRPGWHIECSAMSMRYLGNTVDINGGGSDLIFPHHECSIAQSECATGETFVRHWMHTAMVMYQGKKMSKSDGNMVFVEDLRHMGADAVRLLILLHHYRDTWTYREDGKQKAQELAGLFRQVWRLQSGLGERLDPQPFEKRFHAAMSDDLNVPEALRVMEQLAKEILSDSVRNVSEAKGVLNGLSNLIGLKMRFGSDIG
ncbi:MAG: cysteine--tRNA ligase [Desulfobacteraceae bacterium]|nr:MAG: cysteine--tRNA ligase [Desulfobacteraceae bacterium]